MFWVYLTLAVVLVLGFSLFLGEVIKEKKPALTPALLIVVTLSTGVMWILNPHLWVYPVVFGVFLTTTAYHTWLKK